MGWSRHDRSHRSNRAGRIRGRTSTGRAGRPGACLRARSRQGQAHAWRERRPGDRRPRGPAVCARRAGRRRRAVPVLRRRPATGRLGEKCHRRRRGGGGAPGREAVGRGRRARLPGCVLGLARPGGTASAGVRDRVGDPAVQLVHVEPARRRRAGGGRGPAVRARGPGAYRDDRSPRCRRGRRGRAVQPGSREAELPRHRPRGDHLRPGVGRIVRGHGQQDRVHRHSRRGRTAGHGRWRHARVRRRAVEVLTGSAPRDFASFARDHARLFAPAAAIH